MTAVGPAGVTQGKILGLFHRESAGTTCRTFLVSHRSSPLLCLCAIALGLYQRHKMIDQRLSSFRHHGIAARKQIAIDDVVMDQADPGVEDHRLLELACAAGLALPLQRVKELP